MSVVTLLQVITLSASTLGPSGAPSVEPFRITNEYKADFSASEKCTAASPLGQVYVGKDAIYTSKNGTVTVLLDEYARRYFLDYCQ